jgi:hypothetical protein
MGYNRESFYGMWEISLLTMVTECNNKTWEMVGGGGVGGQSGPVDDIEIYSGHSQYVCKECSILNN